MKLEFTNQQLKELTYCIRGHIIACEEYNMGDEYDINIRPFENLHNYVMNVIQKEDSSLFEELNASI